MPELPEVETVKESLKIRLVGKKILNVFVYYNNIIEYPSVDEFSSSIINQTINDMARIFYNIIIINKNIKYLLSNQSNL